MREVIEEGHADAVCLSSMLHYGVIRTGLSQLTTQREGNVEFLKSGRRTFPVRPATLWEVKDQLARDGIPCRPVPDEVVRV